MDENDYQTRKSLKIACVSLFKHGYSIDEIKHHFKPLLSEYDSTIVEDLIRQFMKDTDE